MARALKVRAQAEDCPARVLRVEPGDGTTGVLRDSAVVLKLSCPVDESSLGQDVVTVCDSDGPVAGRLLASGEGDLLVWQPRRPMRPDVLHFVLARGLRVCLGRELPEYCSRFVPGPLALADFAGGA